MQDHQRTFELFNGLIDKGHRHQVIIGAVGNSLSIGCLASPACCTLGGFKDQASPTVVYFQVKYIIAAPTGEEVIQVIIAGGDDVRNIDRIAVGNRNLNRIENTLAQSAECKQVILRGSSYGRYKQALTREKGIGIIQ